MKIKIIALLLAFIPLMACSQTRLLSDFPSGDGVTKIFLNQALVKLGSQYMNSAGPHGEDFSSIVKDIKGIEVYSCDNVNVAPKVNLKFNELVKTLQVEEMVSSEDDGDISKIYLVIPVGASEPTAMLIYNAEESFGEVNIVVIHGKIDLTGMAEEM